MAFVEQLICFMHQSKLGSEVSASVFYEFPCFAWSSGLAIGPLKGLQGLVSVHQFGSWFPVPGEICVVLISQALHLND